MGEAMPANACVSVRCSPDCSAQGKKIENSDHVILIIFACHSFAAKARAELVNSKGLSGRVLPGSARRQPVAEDFRGKQSAERARAPRSAGSRYVAIVWAEICVPERGVCAL